VRSPRAVPSLRSGTFTPARAAASGDVAVAVDKAQYDHDACLACTPCKQDVRSPSVS